MAFIKGHPVAAQVERKRQDIFTAVCIGLIPLALYVAVAFCAVVLTLFIGRVFVPTNAFLVQRQIDLFGFIGGLVLAFMFYAIAALLIIRRTLQRSEVQLYIRVILWTLVTTAFFILSPIIVAILLPQHPAP